MAILSPKSRKGLMWKIGLVGILLATLIGSFFATLRLIGPGTLPSTLDDGLDAERLASHNIFNRSDLIEAAKDVGLHFSTRMRGATDEISRLNGTDVAIRGWLADTGGSAASLTIIVFVAGKKVAMTQTRGEHPGVTALLQSRKLAFGAEKNVIFQASFGCRPDEQPVIVGLGPDKQYVSLSSPRCP